MLVATLLGARVFKRYWPVGGSYWNDTHADTSKRRDVEGIISDARLYTKFHIQVWSMQLLMLGMLYIWGGDVVFSQTLDVNKGLAVIHMYAFMIHRYNVILAMRCLEAINLADEVAKTNDPPSRKERFIGGLWCIPNAEDGTSSVVHKTVVNGCLDIDSTYERTTQLGPKFHTMDDAQSFCTYVIRKLHAYSTRNECYACLHYSLVFSYATISQCEYEGRFHAWYTSWTRRKNRKWYRRLFA